MSQGEMVTQAPHRGRMSRFFGRYIIKNRLQFKFSFIVFAFLSVASLIIWYQSHWVVQSLIHSGAVEGEQAIEQLTILNQNIMYTCLLAVAIVFGLSLFFSHFVAGPIYRMETVFRQMKEGDLSVVVRFRKNDELQDTAEEFNQALMSIRTKLRKERETVSISLDRVKKMAEKLRQEGRTKEAGELDQIIFDLHNNPPQIKV